jgi:hypothetical protein
MCMHMHMHMDMDMSVYMPYSIPVPLPALFHLPTSHIPTHPRVPHLSSRDRLVCLWRYSELLVMFDSVDLSEDRHVDRAEFGASLHFLAEWGVKIDDADRAFRAPTNAHRLEELLAACLTWLLAFA